LIFIHGYSERSGDLQPLSVDLSSALNRPIQTMLLSDYITLDDQVTMADLVQGMHYAWQAHQLPTDPQSVDVVVHSLGGLVLRAFLRTYFPKVSPLHDV